MCDGGKCVHDDCWGAGYGDAVIANDYYGLMVVLISLMMICLFFSFLPVGSISYITSSSVTSGRTTREGRLDSPCRSVLLEESAVTDDDGSWSLVSSVSHCFRG